MAHRARKKGKVRSQVLVAGVRPRERGGRARLGRRVRRGPEVGVGAGIRGSLACGTDGLVEAWRRRGWVRRDCGDEGDGCGRGRRSVWRRDGGRAQMDRMSLGCDPAIVFGGGTLIVMSRKMTT